MAAAPAAATAPDARSLRTALGRWATGVAIVTCRGADGQAVGLTANSFSSLSLDPPLVLWSLRLASPSLEAFGQAGHFAINVLTEAHVGLSRRFATSVPDRFAEGLWSDNDQGVPVLAGAAAVLECALESQQPAGDHQLFIGRVLRVHEAALPPLLFQAGHYRMLGEIL
jgi:flavin reductase (DIM6/NTAB) family NADH-FMN oxidoreductase RutF